MQYKNWFDRKKIALFGLLFIVLVSLIDPIPNISEVFKREINLNKARHYNCLAEHSPAGEDILFIGNPLVEPPFSINLATITAANFLSSRLVVLMDSLEVLTAPDRYGRPGFLPGRDIPG